MKFSDGYWKLQEDVQASYAVATEGLACTADSLTIYALTRKIQHRGDTLNSALLTAHVTSPMQDVIGVRLYHFDGGQERGPEFALHRAGQPAGAAAIVGNKGSFTSGRLSLHILRDEPWNMEFRAGEEMLTFSGTKAFAALHKADKPYIHEQLNLSVGELVYGLGERFGPFVKNGQSVEIWNRDGGTSSDQAYKNVPFYLTNRGYGVFVNHPGMVSFEVASERVSRVQFSVAGEALEYYVIYGPTPAEILVKYTALTGRPALPPPWSFGLWLSTSFTTSYDEETVTHFIQGMADREIPLSVFHFDCFWMRQFNWCDLTWDQECFPDPQGMLSRLKARGLHICVWINPYIAQRSPLFAEGKANGYLIKRPNGDVWQTDDWQAGMGIVDFTNPAAREWYAGKLRLLLQMGVDTFKTDFGERIPTEAVYYDGSDPERMHNYYSLLYNRTVFELLEQERVKGDAVVFARSATAGGQQYPVHWGGDCEPTFEAMAESLRGGLSLSLCGFGFWSHDIGGFEGRPNAAVYKRWLPFGLLSSHSRLHGSSSYRVPWIYDEEAVEVLRRFTNLKCRLMPYIFARSAEAAATGIPVMRAMMLEFPDDPTCAPLDRQFMLGDSLLVAPVFSESGEVEYYLPAGRWTEVLTGRIVEGGRWMRERHGFDSLPLLVRPGSVIATGGRADRPDYDYADGVTLEVYELGDGEERTVVVPDGSGAAEATFTVRRAGQTISVEAGGAGKPWSVLLAGVAQAKSVESGSAQPSERGLLVRPESGATGVRVLLGES